MAKNMKNHYQTKTSQTKYSIEKRLILHKGLFLPLYPKKKNFFCEVFSPTFNNILEYNCLDNSEFNKVNRLNHSSPMNNTTNKFKHFP